MTDSEISLIDLVEKLSQSDSYFKNAKIIMPSDEQLTIKLVNVSLLISIEEVKKDEAIFQNLFWMVLGTIIGSLFTLCTTKDILQSRDYLITACVFIAILIIIMIFSLILKKRFSKRVDILMNKILGRENNSN